MGGNFGGGKMRERADKFLVKPEDLIFIRKGKRIKLKEEKGQKKK